MSSEKSSSESDSDEDHGLPVDLRIRKTQVCLVCALSVLVQNVSFYYSIPVDSIYISMQSSFLCVDVV